MVNYDKSKVENFEWGKSGVPLGKVRKIAGDGPRDPNMTESDAREIFLIRAIEQADPEGELLGADVQIDAAKAAGGAELVEAGSAHKYVQEEAKGQCAHPVPCQKRVSKDLE